jgi:hypothetical protein
MNAPLHRVIPEVSLTVAVSNWITQYGPTMVTVLGGIIGIAYYVYLMYDLYDRRKNRKKPRPKHRTR